MEPGGDRGDVPGGGLHGPGVQGEAGVPGLSDQPVLLPVLHTAHTRAPVPGHHLQPGGHSVKVLVCRQYLAVAESWEGLVSPSTSSRNIAPADLKRRSAASRPERGLTRWRGRPEDDRTELSHCWVRQSCRRSTGRRRGQCWPAAAGPLTGRAWWVCPPSGRRWSPRTGEPDWCSPAWRWSNTHQEERLYLHPLAPLLLPQGLPLVPGAQWREPDSTLCYMSGETHTTSQVESTSPGPKQ